MSITAKIIRNVFSSWMYFFIQFSIGFFLMPFMILRLGKETFGAWVIVTSLTGYIGFLNFGIRGSVVKYVSQFEAKNEFRALNEIINTSLVLYVFSGILAVLITFIFSNYLGIFFPVEQNLLRAIQISFRIMGLNMAIVLFSITFSGILEGFKRQDIMGYIESATFILQSILIVFCLLKNYGIVAVAISICVVNVLRQILRVMFAFRVYPKLKIEFNLFSKKQLKVIFSYSTLLFIVQILRDFIASLPNIILGFLAGPLLVTFYSVASRLTGYLNVLLRTTAGVLMPFISGFEALDDKARLKKSFIVSSQYCYLLVIFFGLIFIIMGKAFLRLWVGEEFAVMGYYPLFILATALILSPSAFTIESLLKGLGRLKTITILTVCEVVVSAGLSFLFFKTLGLVGVALAFSIPYLINYGIILPFAALKILNINVGYYVKEIFLKTAIPSLAFLMFLWFFKNKYNPENYTILIAEIAVSGAVYLLFCMMFILSDLERKYYLSKLKHVFART